MTHLKTYYIATGLENAAQHTEARHVFEKIGAPYGTINPDNSWELTYDWTKGGKITGVHAKASVAVAEMEAIRRAWLNLVLIPDDPRPKLRGTHSELGGGIILNKPTVMVSSIHPCEDSPVFYCHPNVYHARSIVEAYDVAERLWVALGPK